MENYSDEQLKELRNVYDMFDRDESGWVTKSEIYNTLKSLQRSLRDDELNQLLEEVEVNESGLIEFEAFVATFGPKIIRKYSRDELQQIFNFFDTDQSGHIDAEEIQAAFAKLGKEYSREEVMNMINKIDLDSTGQITLDEFAKLLEF